MPNQCSVCPVVPGLVALASAALFSLPVLAADYMLGTPGESYTLAGEMVAENESMSVTKTVRVLELGAVKNAPGGSILLHTTIVVDGDNDERVLCLERREDGFYRVATAKKPGDKARPEKDPQREIPIPLEVGTSWTSVEKGKGKVEIGNGDVTGAIGVAVLALALSLAVRLYEHYGTLDLRKIRGLRW